MDVKKQDLELEAKRFFESHKKQIGQSLREEESVVKIDFAPLAEFSPMISEKLLESPEENLALLELALDDLGLIKNPRIRFFNLPKSAEIQIRKIRAKHLDSFIVIEGIVRQASEVRPQVVNARFECPTCGAILSVLQIDKKFHEPSRCSCGRKGQFKLLSKEMVDAQRLMIEESPDSLDGGEQPRRISVFLKEDLVDPKMEERTTPGSRVRVCGILKEVPVPLPSGSIATRFDLAVEANNVTPLEESFEDLQISEDEEKEILELASDPRVYQKLSQSIAPSVYGFERIKEALLLQLFSGVQKTKSDGVKSRGDVHILLVGDPGVAKSVTLKFISSIAPRGRYVSGKAATGAGLTASVIKDEFLKGWSLEAGAMVLANKGIVCIDEIEKMGEHDRSTMHESMEQQCMMPDFKLTLSDGTETEIGKLVDSLMEKNKDKILKGKDCEILNAEDIELISTDFTNHFPLKADRVSRHLAPKEFVKIELANGREITVTPEHPCWIVKDGKITTIPAENLKEGEFFPIPSEIEIIPQKYDEKNDLLCKILGYHISDGCYELNRSKKTGIQFGNNNRDLIEDYKKAVKSYFKVSPVITKKGKQFSVRVISKSVLEKIKKLDSDLLEKGETKKIPQSIMKLPKENIRYLLRALYDGDGSVSSQKRNGCRVSFVSQNRKLEEQMADLLLRFGIQSSIFKDKNVWRLDISGQDNLSKFLNHISFLSFHKREKLEEYCKKEKTYRTITNISPNCTEKISRIFKELNIPAKKEIGHSIDLGVQKHRNFLQKLVTIAEKYATLKKNKKILSEIEEMKKIAFGFARWSKIKKVSKIKNNGIKWVYDVTIEPHHTFISNGMVLHNTVTISKANIQATLRSQTSVLAAGNPKLGRFDPYTPIPQQIDISPALLSRFDVIFVLRDLPNKAQDEAIATHVLEEHKQEVLREVLEPGLLRKYISYARKRCSPKLTEEAVEEIKEFYISLRNQSVRSDADVKPIPITARQLEAIIRLSESCAKIQLSQTVTREHAKRAINLLKYSLTQVGYDEETKTFDIDRVTTGISSSKRGKIISLKETISQLESKVGKLIPMEEIEKAVEGKMTEVELEEAISQLSKAGDIFRPKKGYIQRL